VTVFAVAADERCCFTDVSKGNDTLLCSSMKMKGKRDSKHVAHPLFLDLRSKRKENKYYFLVTTRLKCACVCVCIVCAFKEKKKKMTKTPVTGRHVLPSTPFLASVLSTMLGVFFFV
jgi:hypothetical protein